MNNVTLVDGCKPPWTEGMFTHLRKILRNTFRCAPRICAPAKLQTNHTVWHHKRFWNPVDYTFLPTVMWQCRYFKLLLWQDLTMQRGVWQHWEIGVWPTYKTKETPKKDWKYLCIGNWGLYILQSMICNSISLCGVNFLNILSNIEEVWKQNTDSRFATLETFETAGRKCTTWGFFYILNPCMVFTF